MERDNVYIGFVTRREIEDYLDYYGIRTEENLKPIENLRENQCLKTDLLKHYEEIFTKCQKIAGETSTLGNIKEYETIDTLDGSEDSLDEKYSYDNSETFNDTLAEMEAFMTNGPDYELENDIPNNRTNEVSFCPPITSTNASVKVDVGTLVKDFSTLRCSNVKSEVGSNSLQILRNCTNLTLDSPCSSDYKFDKNKFGSPIARYVKAPINPEQSSSSCTPKENVKPIFKTPLPKTKNPIYKSIVSPISRYISETPTVPLIKKIVQKTVPFTEHSFKEAQKTTRVYAELPDVFYKPSTTQQITYTARFSPLPKNLNKYISKPLRPEIIKHVGRVNSKNELVEHLESRPLDLMVEDLTEYIDLETSRIMEMSLMVSSEAKFSSELIK